MGNGFPVAAVAGREAIMSLVGNGVAHGCTYAGNAVGMAAGNATLELLETQPILEKVNRIGSRLMKGIDDIMTEHDIPHAMTGLPPMFSYVLGTDEVPTDVRSYGQADDDMYETIGNHLIRHGIFAETDGREPWFLCHALSEADADETLSKFNDSVKVAKE